MPNIDGGHYFLTLLVPVKLGEVANADGTITTHSHILRQELANLPTAQQSQVTIDTGLTSPFARCRRTHFLRLVVIDQPMFNGRDPSNPLISAVTGKNPLIHQPFDVLSRPWLMLATDFDLRNDEPDKGRKSWAEGLWTQSEAEMRAIFAHCHGFETVTSAAVFADYLARCQLDTTMSFNDYWPGRPPLVSQNIKQLAISGLALAAGIAALLWVIFNPSSMAWLFLFVPLGLAGGIAAVAARLWMVGAKGFPPAPDSDLKSVLKSLHVQQKFGFFAEAVQGMDDEALHKSFAQFLADTRPADLESPSQSPGVIRSDGVMLLEHEIRGPRLAPL